MQLLGFKFTDQLEIHYLNDSSEEIALDKVKSMSVITSLNNILHIGRAISNDVNLAIIGLNELLKQSNNDDEKNKVGKLKRSDLKIFRLDIQLTRNQYIIGYCLDSNEDLKVGIVHNTNGIRLKNNLMQFDK